MSDKKTAVFVSGSIQKHILVMTTASAMGLVTLFTVDLVDMYFLSLLGEQELAAAIGFSGTLLFFLTAVSIGLQIAMGAAWFSLVAGAMIAAQYGLGFMILESYNLVQYPTIVIMMITLGIVGYISSALIRVAGNRLMRWREQAIGLAGG